MARDEAPGGDRYRLARTVVPSHYELLLEPDLGSATFSGTACIDVEVHEPVDEVVLNAVDLAVTSALLTGPDGVVLRAEISSDPATERLLLGLDAVATPGPWRLELSFAGVLNDKLVGFYRSTFTAEDGTTQTIAVSQMESTHARRAFPCWDEPSFKATFAVTLVVAEGLTALSNAAQVAEDPLPDGRRRISFATTIPMSTYLVAFVVGPLELTEPVLSRGGVPIRLAHVPGKAHLSSLALEVARFGLDFFAGWFGIAYPGEKLDLVAVPDFAFGAMENLGCVTFREVLVLIDPDTATQQELERVVDVIGHELAHMWFGDLVTMEWWEGIWLNEAFATFMELLATDAYRPDWQRWVSFGLSRAAAFEVDALASTRPIEYPVVSPDDAEGMFDLLTYEKGAAVLRMLEQYLGPDAFRDGIRHYLRRHRFANTRTTDLWDAIEDSCGEPVRLIMESWINQGGFPAVELTSEPGGARLHLAQQRFVSLDPAATERPGGSWIVPLTLKVGRGGTTSIERVLLEHEHLTVELDEPAEWVLVNAEGSGFYRVRYSPESRSALIAARHLLSPIERYGLVDDSWASLLAGGLDVTELLDLCRGLAAQEEDLTVWQRIATVLVALDRIIGSEAAQGWQELVRNLAGPALAGLGWVPAPGEDDRRRQLRGTLVKLLGTIGADPEVIDRARALHHQHLDGEVSLDPALGAAAIDVVASTGTAAEFELFHRRTDDASTPQERDRYRYALADFPGEAEIDRLLAMSLSEEIRTQDVAFVLRRALQNRLQGTRAWAFIYEHWEELCERIPSMTVVRMLEGIKTLSDPGIAADVEAFFATHPLPQAAQTLAQHIEAMRVGVGLRQREAARLAAAVAS